MPTFHRRTRIAVGAIGLALAATPLAFAPAQALSNVALSFTGQDGTGTPLATCDTPKPQYTGHYTPSDNDGGSGADYAALVLIDGNGTLQNISYAPIPTSSTQNSGTSSIAAGNYHPFGARPLTMTFYDLSGPISASTPDDAYAQIKQQGRVAAADTIDPATIPGDGVCASKPFVKTTPVVGVTRSPQRVTRKTREVLTMTVAAPAHKQPVGSVVFTVTNGKRRFHHHRVPRVLSFTAPLSNGSASVTLPRLKKGGHAWSATYSGDTFTASSTRSGGFRVVKR